MMAIFGTVCAVFIVCKFIWITLNKVSVACIREKRWQRHVIQERVLRGEASPLDLVAFDNRYPYAK